jgi:multimeric flavodoxin WrbA
LVDQAVPAADRAFMFVLGGARPGGSTERLARKAAARLPAQVAQRWLRLAEHPLPAFSDHRHSGKAAEPSRHELVLLEATLSATDLVIVSPLYWYSVSAATKLYLDHWSGWMQRSDIDFRRRMNGKTLWAVTTLAGGEPDAVGPMIEMLQRSAGYLNMRWGGTLVGTPDSLTDPGAAALIEEFFTTNPEPADTPVR